MSFSLTAGAILDRSKTVTRRLGWVGLQQGTELRAVRKAMGRRKGEPLEDLALIRVVSVRHERLSEITPEDVAREGYASLSTFEFIEKFGCAMNCPPWQMVTRIEFEYLDPARST